MAQDALDDILLVDERNDAHLPVSTSGTAAGRPHTFLDQLAPLLGRNAAYATILSQVRR